MSFILDALKKAERDRHALRVPTLQTVHGGPPPPRRARWPWYALAAIVAVNAAVVTLLLVRPPSPLPIVAIPPERATPVTPPTETAPTSMTAAITDDAAPPEPRVPQPVERAEKPAVQRAPAAAVSSAESSRPAPPRQRSAAEKPAAEPAVPRGAPPAAHAAPPVPQVMPITPHVAPAPAVSPRVATAPPRPEIGKAETPRVEAPRTAPATPALAPAPVAPVSPPKPAGRGLLSLAEMPPAFQASVPAMRLQVLVYDRAEKNAWVFINDRKYVVGDKVNGDITVESITEDGAVLSFQGQRFLLRQ